MIQNDCIINGRHILPPYFEDEYWLKKDELDILKWMYKLLKNEGITFEEDATGMDFYYNFLEKLLDHDNGDLKVCFKKWYPNLNIDKKLKNVALLPL